MFWSTLFSLMEIQLKLQMAETNASLLFYDDQTNKEFSLKLKISNILLFRESLTTKMKKLKVKCTSQKIVKGQPTEKRLSQMEIRNLITSNNISEIEKHVNLLENKINNGEINDYTVTTFSTLCGKAIEIYGQNINAIDKLQLYLNKMKSVIGKKEVEEFNTKNYKEIKEASELS